MNVFIEKLILIFFSASLLLINTSNSNLEYENKINNLLNYLENIDLEKIKILSNESHIINYYLNQPIADPLSSISKSNPIFAVRENYQYKPINLKTLDAKYQMIIISKTSNFHLSNFETLKNIGFKMEAIEGYNIFLISDK